jgi:hypothetical protein
MLVFEKRALETRPRNVALVAVFIRPLDDAIASRIRKRMIRDCSSE